MRETDTDTGCGTVRCERGITPAAVVRVAANGDRREAAQAGLGSESEIPPSALYAALSGCDAVTNVTPSHPHSAFKLRVRKDDVTAPSGETGQLQPARRRPDARPPEVGLRSGLLSWYTPYNGPGTSSRSLVLAHHLHTLCLVRNCCRASMTGNGRRSFPKESQRPNYCPFS
jgi:hypothetical protein